MRAVQVVRLDGPDAVEVDEVDEPKAGDGQVLIDVEAAGVVFPDLLLTRGEYQMQPDLPFVARQRGRGHGARGARPARGSPPATAWPRCRVLGGFAPTVAVVARDWCSRCPTRCPFDIGAGLPMNYLTAHFVLETRCAPRRGRDRARARRRRRGGHRLHPVRQGARGDGDRRRVLRGQGRGRPRRRRRPRDRRSRASRTPRRRSPAGAASTSSSTPSAATGSPTRCAASATTAVWRSSASPRATSPPSRSTGCC